MQSRSGVRERAQTGSGPTVSLDPDVTVATLAASVHADDLMVLRQVAPGRFLQIGGAGRGAGWAGCLELSLPDEPDLQQALRTRRPVRWAAPSPRPVLGPYHACHAALVGVDHDVAVLMGGEEPLADDVALSAVARGAVALVGAVTPAKRLADELELLTAVRAVMHCAPTDVEQTLLHVATTAAEALGCELAIAWLPEQDELVVVERGWSLDVPEAALLAALQQLRARSDELPLCRQDSEGEPLPAPLDAAHGVRSHYVLPLGAPASGLLVLLHTVVTPRGFTGLCRAIGEKMAEAAGVVVHSSVLREELQSLVRHAQAIARQDPLTGVANRRGWDEALRACADRGRSGSCASVLVVDLNGLKAVNDRQGHEAGDRFLQMGADALCSVARRGDTVARLGGDEFGLLLPEVDEVAARRVCDRVREAVATAGRVGDVPLSAAVGSATTAPGESLLSAWRGADAAMYEDKAGRRTPA